MELKDNIKKYRLLNSMTLEDVAEKVGVSRQTIQKYESGVISNIPSDKIEKIAKALKVSPGILMGWEQVANDPILHATKEEQLINTISFKLHDNSGVGLSNIKRGNKVDVLKSDEGVVATYDVELVLKAYEVKPIKEKFSLKDIEDLADRFAIPEDLKGITRKQYIKFMGESAMFFDDTSISDETKEKILLSFQKVFYDAKERNKRKKEKK